MGGIRSTYEKKMIAQRVFVGKTEGKDHSQDLVVNGRII
jgi:hypothetical protein